MFSWSKAEIAGEVTARGKARDIADESDKSGSGEQADSWNCEQMLDDIAFFCQKPYLPLDIPDTFFKILDFGAGIGEKRMQGRRKFRVISGHEVMYCGDHLSSPLRDEDADFAEYAPGGVDTSCLLGHVGGSEPVQAHQYVLVDSFDGYWMDVLVSEGFEQSFCVGRIGFVTCDIWTDGMRREKDHRVSEAFELPGPVMGTAAGLENDRSWLALYKEL